MEHPGRIPEAQRELLAVYDTHDAAVEARRAALGVGVPEAAITMDGVANEQTSLKAEMREELEKSWMMPAAAIATTDEGLKGTFLAGIVCCALALVVIVPFAFIDWGLSLPMRLLIHVVVALLVGASVAVVAGPALASRRSDEVMGAHRGSTLRVAADSEELRRALDRPGLIRLDEVTHDLEPMGAVITEDDRTARGVAEQMADNVRQGDDTRRKPI